MTADEEITKEEILRVLKEVARRELETYEKSTELTFSEGMDHLRRHRFLSKLVDDYEREM